MPYESEADCATGQAVQESEARYDEESKLVAWSPAPFSNISTDSLWRAPTKRTEHKPVDERHPSTLLAETLTGLRSTKSQEAPLPRSREERCVSGGAPTSPHLDPGPG